MSEENKGSSPPSGDVKSTNLSATEATQKLLQSYLPKPETEEQTPKATEAGPVQNTATVAEEPSDETPAVIEEVPVSTEAESHEGDDVLSHNTDLSPEEREKFKAVSAQWQEGVNKRIGKEKQKRLDAEMRMKELEEQLQKVAVEKPEPIVVTAPTQENPLADVNDVQSLVSREKEANDVIDQAQAALDQLEIEGGKEIKIGDSSYTRQQLREIRRNAERVLREHIPGRQRFLAQQVEFKKLVKRDIPEMLDPKSQMYREAQQARLAYPQLAYLPNGDYLIGLALRGAKALAAEQASKSKPVVAKPPVSQVVTTGAASTQSRAKVNGTAQFEAEKKKVFAKGNVSGAEAAGLLLARELSTSRSHG